MKQRLFAAAGLAALSLAVAAPAHASGPYIGGFGGLDNRVDVDESVAAAALDQEFDSGTIYGAAVGYAVDIPFLASLRLEGEYAKRSAEFDGYSFDSGNVSVSGGETEATSYMVNAALDLDLPLIWLEPYVGAGIGQAEVESSFGAIDFGGSSVTDLQTSSETGTAYQLFAGVNAPLPFGPEVFVEGRYFTVGETSVTEVELNGTNVTTIEADYASASLLVGGRFRF